MDITLATVDPMPDAERGTLEYAASASACRTVIRIDLSPRETQGLCDVIARVMDMGHDANVPVSLLWLSQLHEQLKRRFLEVRPGAAWGEDS